MQTLCLSKFSKQVHLQLQDFLGCWRATHLRRSLTKLLMTQAEHGASDTGLLQSSMLNLVGRISSFVFLAITFE